MTSLLATQDVVDVKDVIAVFVIVTVVLHALARFRQHTPRVPRGLVVEVRIADAIRRRKVRCQGLKGLWSVAG